jgi:hypothetical protein
LEPGIILKELGRSEVSSSAVMNVASSVPPPVEEIVTVPLPTVMDMLSPGTNTSALGRSGDGSVTT